MEAVQRRPVSLDLVLGQAVLRGQACPKKSPHDLHSASMPPVTNPPVMNGDGDVGSVTAIITPAR
jgi:hypothetical protein